MGDPDMTVLFAETMAEKTGLGLFALRGPLKVSLIGNPYA